MPERPILQNQRAPGVASDQSVLTFDSLGRKCHQRSRSRTTARARPHCRRAPNVSSDQNAVTSSLPGMNVGGAMSTNTEGAGEARGKGGGRESRRSWQGRAVGDERRRAQDACGLDIGLGGVARVVWEAKEEEEYCVGGWGDYLAEIRYGLLAIGNSAVQAILLLLEKGVDEANIIFLNLISAPQGVHVVCKRFPRIKIVTSEIEDGLNEDFRVIPGMGEFGDRYFGTDENYFGTEDD